jgi:hypothetical protein
MTNDNALLPSNSGRGGYRDNAGRKSSWRHSATQTIRVPKVFAQQLVKLAHQLDNGEAIDIDTKSKQGSTDNDTDSKSVASDIVTNSILPLKEALVQAAAILKAKRSARESLAKLLSKLYHTKIQPDDLS